MVAKKIGLGLPKFPSPYLDHQPIKKSLPTRELVDKPNWVDREEGGIILTDP
jgi:hypothetical protein